MLQDEHFRPAARHGLVEIAATRDEVVHHPVHARNDAFPTRHDCHRES
jgi:hypothetical protein